MAEIKFNFNGSPHTVEIARSTYFLKYPCIHYAKCYPISSELPAGRYVFEVWGAQGGSKGSIGGGKGGYSYGIVTLRRVTKAYFFIGEQGGSASFKGYTNTTSAFNGGGNGMHSNNENASSGGGGTDIRLVESSLFHRIIVAGGGGGTPSIGQCAGGVGGGKEGANGNSCNPGAGGIGASQTSGGNTLHSGNSGTFGQGGYKISWDGCGGGGGWFGGGAGSSYVSGGGGGSGFVFNKETLNNARKQGLAISTNYLMDKSFTLSGKESFPAFHAFTNETGHEGHGAIAITYISLFECSLRRFRTTTPFLWISIIISVV